MVVVPVESLRGRAIADWEELDRWGLAARDVLDGGSLVEDLGTLVVNERRAKLAAGLVADCEADFALDEGADAPSEARGEIHLATPADAVVMTAILVNRRRSDLNETAELNGRLP